MSLSTSNFKKLLNERIILIIPFVVLFILLFSYYAPKTDEKRVIENNSFWKKKTFDKKKYNIVIGGDSRIYRGISPYAMHDVFANATVINFGYGSAGFDDIMLREIDKRINYKSDFKAVILGVTPLTLTREGILNYHLVYELNTKREELIELMYFKKILQLFSPITIKQISQKINGKEFSTGFHQDYTPSGWVATLEDKPWQASALSSYSTRFINNQVDSLNLLRLVNQVNLWTQKKVYVFAFRPPTTMDMVALEDSVSGYNEALVKQQIINVGGIWLDFDLNNYETYDGSHLQKESAINFSTDLAEKMHQIIMAEN